MSGNGDGDTLIWMLISVCSTNIWYVFELPVRSDVRYEEHHLTFE